MRALREFFMRRWRQLLLAIAAGCLYFTGFVGLDQWYLEWLCLVPVLWALDDPTLSRREALAIAWLFGLTTHMGGYTWIVGMLRDFAYLPLPLAFLGYVLLCWLQGSQLAAWGFAWHELVHRRGAPRVWTAPVLMAAIEWLYPLIFDSYLANSQYRQLPFIQSLELWGPIGLGFMLSLTSAVLYELLAWKWRGGPRPLVAGLSLAALVAFSLGYGFWRIGDVEAELAGVPERIKVGIVQTNMGIYEKTRKPSEGLRRHRDQSLELQARGAQLIVWPESGYYYSIPEGTPNVAERVMGPDLHTPLIFGAIRVDHLGGKRKIWNSAFLADGDGTLLGSYDKIFLLAFGEYLPFGDWFPFVYDLSPNTSHFERGTRTEPLVVDGVRYGVDICYEDIQATLIRRQMAHDPHVLINITNDAWYGDTREPLIHLALASFRAVENRRYLVRSTNTGISAIVDPVGRVVLASGTFERASLLGEVVPLTGLTLFARFGHWPGALSLLVLLFWLRRLGGALWAVVRRRQAQR